MEEGGVGMGKVKEVEEAAAGVEVVLVVEGEAITVAEATETTRAHSMWRHLRARMLLLAVAPSCALFQPAMLQLIKASTEVLTAIRFYRRHLQNRLVMAKTA